MRVCDVFPCLGGAAAACREAYAGAGDPLMIVPQFMSGYLLQPYTENQLGSKKDGKSGASVTEKDLFDLVIARVSEENDGKHKHRPRAWSYITGILQTVMWKEAIIFARGPLSEDVLEYMAACAKLAFGADTSMHYSVMNAEAFTAQPQQWHVWSTRYIPACTAPGPMLRDVLDPVDELDGHTLGVEQHDRVLHTYSAKSHKTVLEQRGVHDSSRPKARAMQVPGKSRESLMLRTTIVDHRMRAYAEGCDPDDPVVRTLRRTESEKLRGFPAGYTSSLSDDLYAQLCLCRSLCPAMVLFCLRAFLKPRQRSITDFFQ